MTEKTESTEQVALVVRPGRKSPNKPPKMFRYTVERTGLHALTEQLFKSGSVTVIADKPVRGKGMKAATFTQKKGPAGPTLVVLEQAEQVILKQLKAPAMEGDSVVAAEAFSPSARARAILRGIEIAEADLAKSGGAYDLPQVQRIMRGVSRQRIERRVKDGSLLAVPGPSNRRRYPTLQFNDDGSVVDGLKEVQEALQFSSPWAVLNFLINPNDLLNNEKPIEVLRRGELDRVRRSARSVGVQGA